MIVLVFVDTPGFDNLIHFVLLLFNRRFPDILLA
jgi:hypothetical protein